MSGMRKSLAFIAAGIVVLSPAIVFAETLTNPLAGGGIHSLTDFLEALLELVVLIGFPLIVLFIVWIGFRFVQESAAGNAEKIKELRGLLLWAIVGALILLGAQALSIAIQATVEQLQTGL